MSKGVSAPYEVVGIEAVAVEGVAVMEGGQGQDTSLAGQLRDLQASKEQDLLSEAEYAAARASVLARFSVASEGTRGCGSCGSSDSSGSSGSSGRGRACFADFTIFVGFQEGHDGVVVAAASELDGQALAPPPAGVGCQLRALLVRPHLQQRLHDDQSSVVAGLVQRGVVPGGVREVRAAGIQPLREGGQGLPIELARGGHHYSIVALLEAYKNGEVCKTGTSSPTTATTATTVTTATTATSPGPFAGHIPASDIAGLWCCMCWPF
eukprot:CAMPEP_0173370462 /NCGR_PEP_ID=MMETSP1144-20121109/26707_1 /TAXON_ID=483371 /ORGANISM="non described non described, Strain CCMP2298" /LENGTH=265 /DNA_ID=CAMNT_0014322031 /DNA_START=131 /DNA_END=926 /DNA_ORIENTATION=-